MNKILLEDAYALVQAKQFLLSEGYSNEEIDILITEGKVWDAVKKVGKNVGRAAAIGAAGLSMMGGSAKGSDLDNDVAKWKQGMSQSISQMAQDTGKASIPAEQQQEAAINAAIKEHFTKGITKDSITAIKQVIQINNVKADKIKDLIKNTASLLGGDGSSHTSVYMKASGLAR